MKTDTIVNSIQELLVKTISNNNDVVSETEIPVNIQTENCHNLNFLKFLNLYFHSFCGLFMFSLIGLPLIFIFFILNAIVYIFSPIFLALVLIYLILISLIFSVLILISKSSEKDYNSKILKVLNSFCGIFIIV